jgi:hypothetical protein
LPGEDIVGLPRINTLAYFASSSVKQKKKYIFSSLKACQGLTL